MKAVSKLFSLFIPQMFTPAVPIVASRTLLKSRKQRQQSSLICMLRHTYPLSFFVFHYIFTTASLSAALLLQRHLCWAAEGAGEEGRMEAVLGRRRAGGPGSRAGLGGGWDRPGQPKPDPNSYPWPDQPYTGSLDLKLQNWRHRSTQPIGLAGVWHSIPLIPSCVLSCAGYSASLLACLFRHRLRLHSSSYFVRSKIRLWLLSLFCSSGWKTWTRKKNWAFTL